MDRTIDQYEPTFQVDITALGEQHVRQTLKYWKNYCAVYVKLHSITSVIYHTLYLVMFLLMFCTSGASTALSLLNVQCNYSMNTAAGAMSITSNLLLVLQKQFNIAELADSHNKSMRRYSTLITELDILYLNEFDQGKHEMLAKHIILKVRKELNDIWLIESRPSALAIFFFEWRNKETMSSILSNGLARSNSMQVSNNGMMMAPISVISNDRPSEYNQGIVHGYSYPKATANPPIRPPLRNGYSQMRFDPLRKQHTNAVITIPRPDEQQRQTADDIHAFERSLTNIDAS